MSHLVSWTMHGTARSAPDVAKQARRQSAVRTAAAKAMASADASGYGSDEEVYATAKAVDDADGYDEQRAYQCGQEED